MQGEHGFDTTGSSTTSTSVNDLIVIQDNIMQLPKYFKDCLHQYQRTLKNKIITRDAPICQWNKTHPQSGETKSQKRNGKNYTWCLHCKYWDRHKPGKGEFCKGSFFTNTTKEAELTAHYPFSFFSIGAVLLVAVSSRSIVQSIEYSTDSHLFSAKPSTTTDHDDQREYDTADESSEFIVTFWVPPNSGIKFTRSILTDTHTKYNESDFLSHVSEKALKSFND